jgi:hypothetical protein
MKKKRPNLKRLKNRKAAGLALKKLKDAPFLPSLITLIKPLYLNSVNFINKNTDNLYFFRGKAGSYICRDCGDFGFDRLMEFRLCCHLINCH